MINIPLLSNGASDGKESACNIGHRRFIPGLGRSPREGNGYPCQYSYLENSMDRGPRQATVHGIAENQTRLEDKYFHFPPNLRVKKNETPKVCVACPRPYI